MVVTEDRQTCLNLLTDVFSFEVHHQYHLLVYTFISSFSVLYMDYTR